MSAERSPHLSARDVAEQVAAILGAAGQDAMAIVEKARSEPASGSSSTWGVSELVRSIDALTTRVEGLDTRVRVLEHRDGDEVTPSRRESASIPDDARVRAARVRAVDLALAGRTRQAIGDELASIVGTIDAERLLDEVLDPS